MLLNHLVNARYNQLKHKATDEDMESVDELLKLMQASATCRCY